MFHFVKFSNLLFPPKPMDGFSFSKLGHWNYSNLCFEYLSVRNGLVFSYFTPNFSLFSFIRHFLKIDTIFTKYTNGSGALMMVLVLTHDNRHTNYLQSRRGTPQTSSPHVAYVVRYIKVKRKEFCLFQCFFPAEQASGSVF